MVSNTASKNKKPQYSFIVPAYNVGAYIETCLQSLLVEQATNCEIIVVNDGSTDDTLSRIHEFASDPRIVVIDKPNGGLSDARNAGIDRARGQYLMFIDGDDWVEPETIPYFERELSRLPNTDLIVFGFYEVYGDTRYPNRCTADFRGMTNSACNKLFNRDLFEHVRFDSGIWYEDLAVVPYLYVRAKAPLTLDAVLYNYRRDREDSIMNSIDFKRIYDLPVAAKLCLDRIHQGELEGSISPMAKRFGDDWEAEFVTTEIFIPGILHRARLIPNRAERKRYIEQMLSRLPSRQAIRLDTVYYQYGLKMSLGSALYRFGHPKPAHWLLHDLGDLKRYSQSRFKRLTNALKPS